MKYLLAHWIAISALLLSGASLYWNFLRPFKLNVRDGGRVEMGINPYRVPKSEFALSVDLIFSNQGARTGVVEDVALHITLPSKEKIVFRSFLVYGNRRKSFENPPAPPELETFLSFELKGNESVVKKIMFIPHEVSATVTTPKGSYTADIYVRTSQNQEWKNFDSLDFTYDQEDIDALTKTTVTPDPKGGYIVNLITRDKSTGSTQRSLDELEKKLKTK